MTPPFSLLAALMEAPAEIEAEFNDWYDTEHLPERRPIEGFLTLQRFVCTAGTPRYLAVYDLAGPGVLPGPGYAAVSGDNTSPWSLRLAPLLRDRQRVEAVQLIPGQALLDAVAEARGLALWHWRGHAPQAAPALAEAVRALYAAHPAFLQLRLFGAETAQGLEHVALVEFSRPLDEAPAAGVPGPAGQHLLRANHYRRYERAVA